MTYKEIIEDLQKQYGDREPSEEHNYSVYVHTIPKEISDYDWDKYYVGISNDPKYRWGRKGNGYKYQLFGRAIRKYGWDNIRHDIILNNLSNDEAENIEKYLIKELNLCNSQYGYNCTEGGAGLHGYKCSEETRQLLSKKSKQMWKDNYDKLLAIAKTKSGKNHPFSKAVVVLNTGMVFESVNAAGKYFNCNPDIIGNYCSGKNYSHIKDDNGELLCFLFEEDYIKLSSDEISKIIYKTQKYSGKEQSSDPYVCLNTGEVFKYSFEAEEKYNVSHSDISSCCSGDGISAGSLPDGTRLAWAHYSDYIKMSEDEINTKIIVAKNRSFVKTFNRFVVDLINNKLYSSIKKCSECLDIPATSLQRIINGTGMTKKYKSTNNRFIKYSQYLKENNLSDNEARKNLIFVC